MAPSSTPWWAIANFFHTQSLPHNKVLDASELANLNAFLSRIPDTDPGLYSIASATALRKGTSQYLSRNNLPELIDGEGRWREDFDGFPKPQSKKEEKSAAYLKDYAGKFRLEADTRVVESALAGHLDGSADAGLLPAGGGAEPLLQPSPSPQPSSLPLPSRPTQVVDSRSGNILPETSETSMSARETSAPPTATRSAAVQPLVHSSTPSLLSTERTICGNLSASSQPRPAFNNSLFSSASSAGMVLTPSSSVYSVPGRGYDHRPPIDGHHSVADRDEVLPRHRAVADELLRSQMVPIDSCQRRIGAAMQESRSRSVPVKVRAQEIDAADADARKKKLDEAEADFKTRLLHVEGREKEVNAAEEAFAARQMQEEEKLHAAKTDVEDRLLKAAQREKQIDAAEKSFQARFVTMKEREQKLQETERGLQARLLRADQCKDKLNATEADLAHRLAQLESTQTVNRSQKELQTKLEAAEQEQSRLGQVATDHAAALETAQQAFAAKEHALRARISAERLQLRTKVERKEQEIIAKGEEIDAWFERVLRELDRCVQMDLITGDRAWTMTRDVLMRALRQGRSGAGVCGDSVGRGT